jgi:hypothetical protein
MINIEAFKPEHAEQIQLREIDLKSILPIDPVKMIQNMARTGPFYTGFVDDEILFICGLMIFWRGFAEAWTGTTDLVEKYPILFTKAIKRLLSFEIENRKLNRVQLNVVENHLRSLLWVKLLGFTLESKMERYGPNGETYYRFVRFD